MASSKSYKIAVVPGDGTGPEVVAEGLKVLKAAAASESIGYELVYYDLGGERYKKTGRSCPIRLSKNSENLMPFIWARSVIRMSNRASWKKAFC